MSSFKQSIVRRASRGIVGGMRPPDSPLASWLGKVMVALPGEEWPMSQGRPMMPLCQLNLMEAPFVPDNLKDVALLTMFFDGEELPFGTPNGEGWQLRAYPSVDGLAPIVAPDNVTGDIRPFAISWELIPEDYPCWDDVAQEEIPDDVGDDYEEMFPNQEGTKIGGWPTLIQSEIYWAPHNRHAANPEYAFQIGSEPKARLEWGDAGVGYFGRGTGESTDVWTFEWQCY